jgi:hypothetical protein
MTTRFTAIERFFTDLTWLKIRGLAWPRAVDVLFCVRTRRNLNTKVGP